MTMPSIHDQSERTYLRMAVANEIDRLNVDRGSENSPFGGWRNTAIDRIAQREGMNPYTLDRIIREGEPETLTYEGCTSRGLLSTPEDVDSRTGERRLLENGYRLHADHVDTVRLALMARRDEFIPWMDEDFRKGAADYWAGELWAIERACRALGIED